MELLRSSASEAAFTASLQTTRELSLRKVKHVFLAVVVETRPYYIAPEQPAALLSLPQSAGITGINHYARMQGTITTSSFIIC